MQDPIILFITPHAMLHYITPWEMHTTCNKTQYKHCGSSPEQTPTAHSSGQRDRHTLEVSFAKEFHILPGKACNLQSSLSYFASSALENSQHLSIPPCFPSLFFSFVQGLPLSFPPRANYSVVFLYLTLLSLYLPRSSFRHAGLHH